MSSKVHFLVDNRLFSLTSEQIAECAYLQTRATTSYNRRVAQLLKVSERERSETEVVEAIVLQENVDDFEMLCRLVRREVKVADAPEIFDYFGIETYLDEEGVRGMAEAKRIVKVDAKFKAWFYPRWSHAPNTKINAPSHRFNASLERGKKLLEIVRRYPGTVLSGNCLSRIFINSKRELREIFSMEAEFLTIEIFFTETSSDESLLGVLNELKSLLQPSANSFPFPGDLSQTRYPEVVTLVVEDCYSHVNTITIDVHLKKYTSIADVLYSPIETYFLRHDHTYVDEDIPNRKFVYDGSEMWTTPDVAHFLSSNSHTTYQRLHDKFVSNQVYKDRIDGKRYSTSFSSHYSLGKVCIYLSYFCYEEGTTSEISKRDELYSYSLKSKAVSVWEDQVVSVANTFFRLYIPDINIGPVKLIPSTTFQDPSK